MSFKDFLDKIFKLPPVEERPDISKTWVAKFYIRDASEKKDDIYIYFLIYKTVGIVYCLLSLLFIMAYITNIKISLFPYKDFTAEEFKVAEVMYQYTSCMLALILGVIYPFFLVKFLWNINPKKVEVLKEEQRKKRTRGNIILMGMMGVMASIGIMIYGYIVQVAFPLNIFYGETLASLVFFIAIGVVSFFIGASMLLGATVTLVRYVGPYEGKGIRLN